MRTRILYVLILLVVMLTLVRIAHSCRCDKDAILRICQCPQSRRLGQRPLADRFANLSTEIRNQHIRPVSSSQETLYQRQHGQQGAKSKPDGAKSNRRPRQDKSKQVKPKRPLNPKYTTLMKLRTTDASEPNKVDSLKSINLPSAQDHVSVHFVAMPEPIKESKPEPEVQPEPEVKPALQVKLEPETKPDSEPIKVIAEEEEIKTNKTTNDQPAGSNDAEGKPDEYLSMNRYLLLTDDDGANGKGKADTSANDNNDADVNDGANDNPDDNANADGKITVDGVQIPDLNLDEDIGIKMRVKKGRSKRLLLALQRAGAGTG